MKFLAQLYSHSIRYLLPLVVLCACANDQDELRDWMNQERVNARPSVQPIPEPKTFTPFVYEQQAALDPFTVQKVDAVLLRAARQGGGVRPDLNRRREPLESFPLDTISMVGTLKRGRSQVALLKVDQTVYQARIGNYIGQNFGKITQVTENGIEMKETVQDAAGDWVERVNTLQLQEKQESSK